MTAELKQLQITPKDFEPRNSISEKDFILDYNVSKLDLLLKGLVSLLNSTKKFFDDFDNSHIGKSERVRFVEQNKKNIFSSLDFYFEEIWHEAKSLPRDFLEKYLRSYVNSLVYFLDENSEINRHIREKPLGYGGDFVTMNYIYDYHQGNYLGDSSYQILVNHYTTNIKVACSNMKRKDFLKREIEKVIEIGNPTRVLSVGSGPAREILELLSQNKFSSRTEFNCLDFERTAIEYVKERLRQLDCKNNNVEFNFFETNLIHLLKDRNLLQSLTGQNLIYVSGVFDYLSDRLCSHVTTDLFELLSEKGQLIICNISLPNAMHRAYYEMFGGWVMNYRTISQMEDWLTPLRGRCTYKFESVPGGESYYYLRINRS